MFYGEKQRFASDLYGKAAAASYAASLDLAVPVLWALTSPLTSAVKGAGQAGLSNVTLEDMAVVLGWLFGKSKTNTQDDELIEWEPAGKGMVKNILKDYSEDYVIYAGFGVTGITFRFVDAANFANSQDLLVELEREPTNQHDRNAIKVIGVCQRGRYFIGYVPKDISAQITRSGMYDVLRPRLVRIYTAPQVPDSNFNQPYLEIQIQLVGPKIGKAEFEQAVKAPRKRKAAS